MPRTRSLPVLLALLALVGCGGGRIVSKAAPSECPVAITPSTFIVTANGVDQSMAIVCVGDTVPSSTNPATTTAPTSAPTTSTTSPTSTSAPTTTTTTTIPPSTSTTATTAPGSGQFSETFANGLGGWVLAHGKPAANDDCVPVGGCPTTLAISNGKLVVVNGEQDYGDATARSLTKYNLANGGTVTLDIVDNGGSNRLVGSAYIMFSAGPQDAKHQHALSVRPLSGGGPYCVPLGTTGCIPTEGVTVWLMDNCAIPWGPPIVVRYPSMVDSQGNCAYVEGTNPNGTHFNLAAPDGHLRLVYTTGHLSIRNGANVEIVAYNVSLPAVGYLTLGVHNHASMKYSGARDVTGTFDNVTYPTG